MRCPTIVIATTLLAAGASAAIAGETLTYTYDAKGRLVKVEHTGSVNNGIVSNYAFDKADNRINSNNTGA